MKTIKSQISTFINEHDLLNKSAEACKQALENWRLESPEEYKEVFSNSLIDKTQLINTKCGYFIKNIMVQYDYLIIFYDIIDNEKMIKMKYEYIVDANGNAIDDILRVE